MSEKHLNRRDFLKATAMMAVGALAASCAQPEPAVQETPAPATATQAPAQKEATPSTSQYKDPPALADRVASGELPPIEERISQEPLVVTPVDSIGAYGGTLRTINAGTSSSWMTNSAYEKMLRWSIDATEIEPNVAKQWEVSDDGKVWTLYLRRGSRWSDGEPFTVEDVVFQFEDIWGNEELSPTFPGRQTVGGEPLQVEVVDDYAFRLVAAAPWGFGAHLLAYFDLYRAPKHYLTQFHAEYAQEGELNALVEEAELEDWTQLFGQQNDWYNNRNPDLPVLMAWYPTSEPPTTLYVFERNPYYWKVDTEGKQLPYIGQVRVSMVQDAEVLRLQTLAGRTDLQDRTIDFDVYPLLKEGEEDGDYTVLLYQNPRGAVPAIMPNLNVNDEVLRELMQDDRFRIALSHAINRNQINEVVWSGMAEPRQATVATMSPIFKPEYASAYAEYDTDRANALLDELGLTERDGDGFRLRPDGDTLFLLIETPGEQPAEISQLELVAQHWQEVGVKTELQPSERSQFRNRVYAGEVSVGMWQLDYVYYPFQPTFTVPTQQHCYWAPAYGNWYATGGQAGEEPTGDIRQLQLIWEELQQVTDQETQIEMFRDLFDLHAEHCWMIGIVGHPPRPIVVKNNLRNIPETGIYSWTIGQYFAAIRLEQAAFEA